MWPLPAGACATSTSSLRTPDPRPRWSTPCWPCRPRTRASPHGRWQRALTRPIRATWPGCSTRERSSAPTCCGRRGTTSPERDIDWLLALTAPRVNPTIDTQLRADLTDRDIDRLADTVLDLLAATPDRTRDEVAETVRAKAPDLAERLTGHLVMLLMAHLELDRLVSSGTPRDGEHTYATYADRVGTRVDVDDFDREEALARIALRYFTGHGPATVKDLAYWATLTDHRRPPWPGSRRRPAGILRARRAHLLARTRRASRPTRRAGRSPPAAARRDVPRLPGLPLGPGRPRSRAAAAGGGDRHRPGRRSAGGRHEAHPRRVERALRPHATPPAVGRRAREPWRTPRRDTASSWTDRRRSSALTISGSRVSGGWPARRVRAAGRASRCARSCRPRG